MKSAESLAHANAMLQSILRAPTDHLGRAAGGSGAVCYVADDHGLGQEVSRFCLVYPGALTDKTYPAMAG